MGGDPGGGTERAERRRRDPRDELARAIRLIEGVMQAEGVSPEEVDARLGGPAGGTAALLAGAGGEGEPARRRVREILAALELEPETFSRSLYPEPPAEPPVPRPPLFERLAAELALAGYAPHPADGPERAGEPPDPEELARRVQEAIRAALAGENAGLAAPDDPADPRGERRG